MLIKAHLTDWKNMLGLRDKVKEYTYFMAVTRMEAHLTTCWDSGMIYKTRNGC